MINNPAPLIIDAHVEGSGTGAAVNAPKSLVTVFVVASARGWPEKPCSAANANVGAAASEYEPLNWNTLRGDIARHTEVSGIGSSSARSSKAELANSPISPLTS
jgi:hypothetical protein